MASAKEINIPIVITADGTRAVAGLQKFQREGKKVEGMLSKWSGVQVSAVGGMLFGMLGIGSAIAGLKHLYEESKKLSEIAGTYSPEVISAQAKTTVAKIEEDMAIAKAITPIETRRAEIATEDTKTRGTGLENLTSAFGLQVDLLSSALSLGLRGSIDFALGDFESSQKNFALRNERLLESGGIAAFGLNSVNFVAEKSQVLTNDPAMLTVLRLIEQNTKGGR